MRRTMSATNLRYVYGPVLSRRLGWSLGIDLVPLKTCTYDCIYCQLGRTINKTLERREYVPICSVLMELERSLASGKVPDYISIAGSGEPTLNSGIGSLISQIKNMTDIPVAVLTNGSLLWMDDIQDALMPADLILPSLDAGDEPLFHFVNRPHDGISFERMVEGLAAFTNRFKGHIWLEILLLGGVAGIRDEVKKIALIIKHFKLTRVQLNTVVRPPAEVFALPLPKPQMLALRGFLPGEVDIISQHGCGDSTQSPLSNSRSDDILSLICRRPCTCIDIAKCLGLHPSEAIKDLGQLMALGKVKAIIVNKSSFYSAVGSIDA
jgi:wyosine [tRNA(Phe)-imidazoG37] synthetase (radical SAM superfamily)